MAIEWSPIIIAAVSGLGAGIVGSLVTPWANWNVEKVRGRTKARRELVESCRKLIASGISRHEFRETPEYARLRPHLSAIMREKIESDTITVQTGGRGGGVKNFGPKLLDEISALEDKWKLI